jgi:hypothetical protein
MLFSTRADSSVVLQLQAYAGFCVLLREAKNKPFDDVQHVIPPLVYGFGPMIFRHGWGASATADARVALPT